eukprot:c14343_g1_i1.p1 GENE.c14343_g1_i1~~c14343_g1_i1.p1  ORF type:complete len:414 (-),score=112.44 c14343_g1_i1:39-1280(-)
MWVLILSAVSMPPTALVDGLPQNVVSGDYANGYPYPHPAVPYDIPSIFPFDTSCPDHCSGHGECVNKKCVCELGYSGAGCESAVCAGNCNGRGICSDGICSCRKGWTGSACDLPTCPNNCSGNGVCFEGDCTCSPDWVEIDCSKPRWGVPGLSRPTLAGFPSNVRLNDSCVAIRIPALTRVGGPKLSRAVVTIEVNGTCVKALGSVQQEQWASGQIPPSRSLTLSAGDHIVCDIPGGCEKIRMDSFYEGSNSPIVFIDGVGLPSPSPAAPAPNQVDADLCPSACSGRGVCLNVTSSRTFESHLECQCQEPWIPPCCSTQDRADSAPPAVDPLSLTIGQIPFNRVPCTQDDACFACDQYLQLGGEWVEIARKGEECAWDSTTSRCAHIEMSRTVHSKPCRSSTLPEQLAPPQTL